MPGETAPTAGTGHSLAAIAVSGSRSIARFEEYVVERAGRRCSLERLGFREHRDVETTDDRHRCRSNE